jgi:hypothetical protein
MSLSETKLPPEPKSNRDFLNQSFDMINVPSTSSVTITPTIVNALASTEVKVKKEVNPNNQVAVTIFPVAKALVGALGLADESHLFQFDSIGVEWTDYIVPKYQMQVGSALNDIDEYIINVPNRTAALMNISTNERARFHFAAIVQYHASAEKLAISGTYRQSEAQPYLLNRYKEALEFFRLHNI